MSQYAIKTFGKKQNSREKALFFMVREPEALEDIFDKKSSEWSDFDYWENMGEQQWIFFATGAFLIYLYSAYVFINK